ncbi:MAG TPA: hypothetical protein VMT16_08715 [Thermoanaerobaculia bacterium]|nr:hypothetical protein [Thermoanaerobaculia bacterium]
MRALARFLAVALLLTGIAGTARAAKPAYDVCIHDEDGGGELRLNSQTWEYVICLADGFRKAGTFKRKTPVESLYRFTYKDSLIDMFDLDAAITYDPPTVRFFGSVVLTFDGKTTTLHDNNISNNDCDCQPPGSFAQARKVADETPVEIAAVSLPEERTLVVTAESAAGGGQALVVRTIDASGAVLAERNLADGAHFAVDAARAGENGQHAAVHAIDENFTGNLWALDGQTLATQRHITFPDRIAGGVVPNGGDSLLAWSQTFWLDIERHTRRSDLSATRQMETLWGVGTAFLGDVSPGIAADGAGRHVVVKQPRGIGDLFALCHHDGGDGAGFRIATVGNVSPEVQIREAVITFDPYTGEFLLIVADAASGIVLYRIDCEQQTAKTIQVAPFSVPENHPFFSNEVSVVPLPDGKALVTYCALDDVDRDRNRMLGQLVDDVQDAPQIVTGASTCPSGPKSLWERMQEADPNPFIQFVLLFAGDSLDQTVFEGADPEPPAGPWLASPQLPGFEVKVRITAGGGTIAGKKEDDCIAETLCVSGALAGRAEAFVRAPGPKPNGHLWPTVVKFSTSRVEVWMRQPHTGTLRYYLLPEVAPGERLLDLAGLAHKTGFLLPFASPVPSAAVLAAAGLLGDDPALSPSAQPVPVTAVEAGDPAPPGGSWLASDALPGFRVKVRITAGDNSLDGKTENDCIDETLCVSGALVGRPEAFVRVAGPKPNGYLWPTLVKFSTSQVEVWIEQLSTGEVRYYRLDAVAPGGDLLELAGLADKLGFRP